MIAEDNEKIVRSLSHNDHYLAVLNYTWQMYETINKSLWGGKNIEGYKNLDKDIQLISESLKNCIKYKGITARITTDKHSVLQGNLEKGKVINFKGFTSTSCDYSQDFLMKFSFSLTKDTEEPYYVLFIKSKNGVDISRMSKYESQKQILFDKNSKFKVIGTEKSNTSLRYTHDVINVYLVEV